MTRALALGGTLFLLAVGLLLAAPTALLAAVVPLAYLLATELSAVPRTDLRVSRAVEPSNPAPGERATVTVSVTNEGDSPVADLRFVDPVPEPLTVVDGSPRGAVTLRPESTATISYEFIAKRGRYEYDPVDIRVRSSLGDDEETLQVTAAGATELVCRGVTAPPESDVTQLRVGTLGTDDSGNGLEFRSVREYQHGDPVNRIDWRQYAKTGELATVEYREERSLRVLLLLDCRPPTRQVPEPGYPTGTETVAYAGRLLYDALTDAGHTVGAAALGLPESVLTAESRDGISWADETTPRDSTAVFEQAEAASDHTGSARRLTDTHQKRLLARIEPNTHVILCSPLADEWPVEFASRLNAHGHQTTVITPEHASRATTGGTVAALERETRIQTLRRAGIETVNWSRDQPLRASLDQSLQQVVGR
ncbi:DUF58 domain-containing protein [Halosegnis longus]|uniref:DUF58 domain-containing protein n=1 Tax=Halosegnis longus TaxID=2216012 RepID=A0AAJ4RAK8_9EURY|nr:DUF58 domain-containing protein [Salella cibi]